MTEHAVIAEIIGHAGPQVIPPDSVIIVGEDAETGELVSLMINGDYWLMHEGHALRVVPVDGLLRCEWYRNGGYVKQTLDHPPADLHWMIPVEST